MGVVINYLQSWNQPVLSIKFSLKETLGNLRGFKLMFDRLMTSQQMLKSLSHTRSIHEYYH